MAPEERTLDTWVEAKCHTSILHERIVVGGKVGMNDMWNAMCHEERRKRCSTPM